MEAMEEPSEILRAEHEVILGLLTVLDPMAERLRGGAVMPERDLQDIVSIMADYADRCHDVKEEKVLFPRLASASPVEGARLARRLTGDHQAFRKVVASLRDAIPRRTKGRGGRRWRS
jgi:hemerythrin-like domain-containing protein